MTQRSNWESIKLEGGQLVDHVKVLVHEGNVRRIVIRQGDNTIAEFPLTFGVLGALIAPVLAAVGAIAALVTDCTVDIERDNVEVAATPPDAQPFTSDEVVDM